MKIHNITDVFFDLDHTLWDFDKNSALAFHRVFRNHTIELEVINFVQAYEPINIKYWKLFGEEKVTKEEMRRGRLIETFGTFNMKFPLQTIDALAESYINELPGDNHLFEGTVEILDYLSANYKLHIITNGFQEIQHLKLDKSGIREYFASVTTSEEVGVKKPNPLIFSTAIKKVGTHAHKSIMIGDSFEADIVGAEAAGMQTLFYNNQNEIIPEGYRAIQNLISIKNFL